MLHFAPSTKPTRRRTPVSSGAPELLEQRIAPATAYAWNGSISDDWFTPQNWTPNGVPGSTDSATLGIASTIHLTSFTTVANFTQTAGTLNGDAILGILSTFTWSGGTQSGTGETQVQSDGTLKIQGAATKTLTDRTLNIFGNTTWSGTGNIVFNSGRIRNQPAAFFDIQTDADFVDADGPGTVATFTNNGILAKSAGALGSDATILNGVVFEDFGPMAVFAGELRIAGGGTATGTSIDIEPGAQLTLTSLLTLSGSAQFTGSGTLRIDNGGTLDTPDPLAFPVAIELRDGGTLTGAGDISLDNTVNWTGGTMSGSGKTTISASGTLDLSSAATKTLTRALVNEGALIVESGTLTFGGGFTQTGGSTTLSGGNLAQSGTLDFQGGTLAGAGTITGNVANSGATIQPGGPGAAGTLAITGDYTQVAGSLEIEIGGTTAGTQFDQFTVSGAATLDGTLDVALINGFTLGFAQSFPVLTYGSHTGVFATIDLPPNLVASILATSVTLDSTAPPPTPTISITDAIVLEGDTGTTALTFTVNLNFSRPDMAVTVKFTASDLTAHVGSDFPAQSGIVTFPIGSTQQTFTIDVNGDTLDEFRERLLLTLTDPVNAIIGDDTAIGIIQDNDHHRIAVGSGRGGTLGILDATASSATPVTNLKPFGNAFKGGVRVAVGDINGDGTDDFVAAAGSGKNGRVRIYDGSTLLPFADASHSAFADLATFPGYKGGVFVAVGDVNGDGSGDLIVSTGGGRSNMVKVFSGADATLFTSFQAFPGNIGGVRVAAGDLNGDGFADIVAGTGKNSAVKTFDIHDQPVTPVVLQSLDRIFAKSYRGGVHLATGDLADATHLGAFDGIDDLIIGTGKGRPDTQIIASLSTATPQTFLAYPRPFHGIRVAAADVNGDGIADLLAAESTAGRARATVLTGLDFTPLYTFSVKPKSTDGIYIA